MENGLESFATYEELFKDLVTFIDRELEGVKCKVVLSPSHREVHHFYPMPQPAFPTSLMPLNLKHEFTLAPNPGFVMVNEITFAFANIDTVKELATAMVVKQETNSKTKTELAYEQILSQKHFYPLYPVNTSMALELSQLEALTFLDQKPDVLLLPTDLKFEAKVTYSSLLDHSQHCRRQSQAARFAGRGGRQLLLN